MKDNKIKDYLSKIDSVIENGKYKDNWQSLCSHKTPQWQNHHDALLPA